LSSFYETLLTNIQTPTKTTSLGEAKNHGEAVAYFLCPVAATIDIRRLLRYYIFLAHQHKACRH